MLPQLLQARVRFQSSYSCFFVLVPILLCSCTRSSQSPADASVDTGEDSSSIDSGYPDGNDADADGDAQSDTGVDSGFHCVNPVQNCCVHLDWAKTAPGCDYNYGRVATLLSDGSFIVTGRFSGKVQFAPDASIEANNIGIVFARYDASGKLIWVRQVFGDGRDDAFGIDSFSDDSFIITGSFMSNAIFGKGESNETTLTTDTVIDSPPYAMFVARYNSDGRLIWAKQSSATSWAMSNAVSISNDESIFITGSFSGYSATFGEGESNETTLSNDGFALFIAKYDLDGSLVWAKSAGGPYIAGTEGDIGYGISAIVDGSSLITGIFTKETTFGKGEMNETSLSAPGTAMFIARYNPDGTLNWADKAIGTSDLSYEVSGEKVATTIDGYSYVTGYFRNTSIFGQGESKETTLISNGQEDIFLAKYNPDGKLVWLSCIRSGLTRARNGTKGEARAGV